MQPWWDFLRKLRGNKDEPRSKWQEEFARQNKDIIAEMNYGPLLAQAVYTFSGADPTLPTAIDQQEIYGLVGLRLTDRWSILGSIRFDIDTNQRIQDALQLRYTDDCFVLTATYTETFITNPSRDITEDRSIMLRFEFKYLGDFRYKTNALDTVFAPNQPPQ